METSNDFLKCVCPHCTQNIEYPAEGGGQTIPCPTCEQLLILPTPSAPPVIISPKATKRRRESGPATEKQIERLRSFGCAFDPSITMDDASTLIDQCYRAHPPTKEQLDKITRLCLSDKLPINPTMGDARALLRSEGSNPPTKQQIKLLTDAGFKVVKGQEMTMADLDEWIKLADSPPDPEDLQMLKHYGLNFSGNGFATAVLACLIGNFQDLVEFMDDKNRLRVARACKAAMRDPEYNRITFKVDKVFPGVVATWPQSKVREWFSQAKN